MMDHKRDGFTIGGWVARAQSAEAALAELREAAGAVIKSAEPVRGNDKTGARFIWKYSLEPKPFDALRAALEPRKEGGK